MSEDSQNFFAFDINTMGIYIFYAYLILFFGALYIISWLCGSIDRINHNDEDNNYYIYEFMLSITVIIATYMFLPLLKIAAPDVLG